MAATIDNKEQLIDTDEGKTNFFLRFLLFNNLNNFRKSQKI